MLLIKFFDGWRRESPVRGAGYEPGVYIRAKNSLFRFKNEMNVKRCLYRARDFNTIEVFE